MEPKDQRLQCMSDVEIGAFLRRELEGPRFLECVEHIASCDACRRKLARGHDLAATKLRLERDLSPLVEHVNEEEVQQYVAGRLSLARIREIDGHLTRCPQCAAEIRDLRNFVTSQSTSVFFLPKWFMVGASATLVAIIIAVVSLRRAPEVVSLNDGAGRITLDAHGNLRGVGPLGPDEENIVKQALLQQKLPFPASLQALQEQPGTLMGSEELAPFRLETPVGTAVQNVRPTLSWTADPESAGYRVTIKDENTGEVIQSLLIQATSWTTSRDLERGHVYVWQVISSRRRGQEAIAPNPASPPAKFIVLDTSMNSKLQKLPPSHLVRAVLYANAGLVDDANRELTELQKLDSQSPVVRNLLEQVRRTRANE